MKKRHAYRPGTGSAANIENEKAVFVKLNDDGIIEVEFEPELTEMTTAHLMYLRDQVEKLGGGKKLPVYINTSPYLTITSEGRKYSASEEAAKYTLANAVLVDSFAKRILLNFYLELSRPVIPLKAFPNKQAALEWLKTFL